MYILIIPSISERMFYVLFDLLVYLFFSLTYVLNIGGDGRRATKRRVNVPAKWRTNSSVAPTSSRRARPAWSTIASCTIWIISHCRTDPALSSPPTGRCSTTENLSGNSSKTSASVSLKFHFRKKQKMKLGKEQQRQLLREVRCFSPSSTVGRPHFCRVAACGMAQDFIR